MTYDGAHPVNNIHLKVAVGQEPLVGISSDGSNDSTPVISSVAMLSLFDIAISTLLFLIYYLVSTDCLHLPVNSILCPMNHSTPSLRPTTHNMCHQKSVSFQI